MLGFPSGRRRRDVLRTAVKIVGAGCALATLRSEQVAAQPKVAKTEVRYRDQPNGQQHCAICAYYLPPVACQLVRGEVSPNGWCGLFQPKTG